MEVKLRRNILFLLTLLSTSCVYSQTRMLLDAQRVIAAKVLIGMSAEEVKRSMGRPESVLAGFPKSDRILIDELPPQVGQLNNSTWFYFRDRYGIHYPFAGGMVYRVNGIPVAKEMYDSYLTSSQVFLYEDDVVFPATGQGYRELNDPKLRVRPKYKELTYAKNEKSGTVTRWFTPILCVVFDRGTQVVASVQVFFKPMNL
jgi:hypothetical protein